MGLPRIQPIAQSADAFVASFIAKLPKKNLIVKQRKVKDSKLPKINKFMKNGISAELLKKDDVVKIRIDEGFMISNGTVNPELHHKIGKIVSDVNEKDDEVKVSITSNNEVVSIPKFFCSLKTKIYKERISSILRE